MQAASASPELVFVVSQTFPVVRSFEQAKVSVSEGRFTAELVEDVVNTVDAVNRLVTYVAQLSLHVQQQDQRIAALEQRLEALGGGGAAPAAKAENVALQALASPGARASDSAAADPESAQHLQNEAL